jgi:hypothetical protein
VGSPPIRRVASRSRGAGGGSRTCHLPRGCDVTFARAGGGDRALGRDAPPASRVASQHSHTGWEGGTCALGRETRRPPCGWRVTFARAAGGGEPHGARALESNGRRTHESSGASGNAATNSVM